MLKILNKIFKRSIWTIAALFFVIMMTIGIIAESAVKPYVYWIDDFLGVRRTFLVEKEQEGETPAEPEDTNYYPIKEKYADGLDGWYKLYKDAYAINQQVNEEGTVLLWNKDDALPLNTSTEKNVSTYGIMSLSHKDGKGTWVDNWPYHPDGSATIDLRSQTDDRVDGVSILKVDGYPELNIGPRLSKSLESAGFNVNPAVIESTWANGDKSQMNGYAKNKYTKEEVEWSVLAGDTANNPVTATTSQYNDAVIYTVGRYVGEGDTVGGDWKNTKVLIGLSDKEKSVLNGLSELRAKNQIKKLIVLIAFSNPMDMKDFEAYNIDACLWVGNGGNTSTEAVVSVLTGKANPSGRLVDTWAFDSHSSPAAINDGWYWQYDDPNKLIFNNYTENPDAYIIYQEGIYVGYRYYETRYEDSVLKSGNAASTAGVVNGSGNWSYGKEVAYPFGYGTSYTTFEYGDFGVRHGDGNYTVSVTVKNTGKVAGKETVQVYLQKPYTEFDVNNKIEKASVELVGYAKTETLKPGATETVNINVSEYEFKTYDEYVNKTYILEKGDYYLTVGKNAHDAVNNILAQKGKTVADGMDAEGNKKLVYKTSVSSTRTVENPYGDEVTNQFDDVDINKFDGTVNKVTYLTRNDWQSTYPKANEQNVKLVATEKIAAALSDDKPAINNSDDEKVTFGRKLDTPINLIQMRGVPFDDPMWRDFLDQLTYDDMISLLGKSQMAVTSVAANAGKVYDGPLGYRDGFNGSLTARCAFPCAPTVAATFNDGLVASMSDMYADLCLKFGDTFDDDEAQALTGVWGVSTNIHRTNYNGRNNEYYSEDGFLSGKMCADQVKALTDRGIQTYIKHLILNENEMMRAGGNMWSNEQAIREIYLKAYEASIVEAGSLGVMTSYNRIGCTWTGAHQGLLRGVLFGEWSFTGVTCTDYASNGFRYMGSEGNYDGGKIGCDPNVMANAVIAGQDEWIAGITEDALKTDALKNNNTFCQALRDMAHRNLYTRNYTAAMNGIGSNTRVVIVIPTWQQSITVLKIVGAVMFALALAGTIAGWVFWYLNKKRA